MTAALLYIAFNAAISRAIGSGFWGYITKVSLTRGVGSLLFAVSTALLAGQYQSSLIIGLFPLYYFYSCIATNPYSAMAMNGDNSKGQLGEMHQPFVDYPVKWLKLPTETPTQRRIWGLVGSGIGRSALAPAVIYVAFCLLEPWHALYSLLTLLLGGAYYLAGFLPTKSQWEVAEYVRGAGIGCIFLLVV